MIGGSFIEGGDVRWRLRLSDSSGAHYVTRNIKGNLNDVLVEGLEPHDGRNSINNQTYFQFYWPSVVDNGVDTDVGGDTATVIGLEEILEREPGDAPARGGVVKIGGTERRVVLENLNNNDLYQIVASERTSVDNMHLWRLFVGVGADGRFTYEDQGDG